MWAAMKASGLEFKPSVLLCKIRTLDMGRLLLNLIFALIHVKLECYERVGHGAPSGQAEGNNDDLIEHPGATRDASLSPTQKSKTKSQQIANPGGPRGQASASA